MKKYSKIKRVGHDQNQGMFENPDDQLIIKEKLDGANFRFTFNEDDQLVFGSKNVEYIDEDGEPAYDSSDYEKLDSRFTNAIEYIREEVDVSGKTWQRYTFFGENMVSHSLEYEWEKIPQFIGFDVYDHAEYRWLTVKEAYNLFDKLGLETAPIIMSVDAGAFKQKHNSEEGFPIPESQWRDGKGEGVVIINTDKEENDRSGFNTRAKLVTEEFKEKHKEATGARQSVEAIHGHEKAVSKFCTDQRIRKRIHAMQNEGRKLGMDLMANKDNSKGLPMRVAMDIVEEEYDGFVSSNWKVDFKEFRSLVAKRCVHVLKQEVQKLDG